MIKDLLILGLDAVEFSKRLGIIPDEWQERALRWSGKRLILNCSRQSGKSTVASILALHRALFYPKNLILLISPSLRQSSELFRRVLDLLDKIKLKPKLVEENRLSFKLSNKSRIVSLPSTEETIRGFSGVNLIIEDEASRVDDELYYAVRPMLAVSGGRLLLTSTPFGKRGHFYKEWEDREFEKIKITANECPRISKEFLEEEKKSLGDFYFRQEYLCEFEDIEGVVFQSFLDQDLYSEDFKSL